MKKFLKKNWSLITLALIGISLVVYAGFIFKDISGSNFIKGEVDFEINKFTIWEFVAMIWACPFGFYYIFATEIDETKNAKLFSLGFGILCIGIPLFSLYLIATHNTIWHLRLDFLLILTYTLADGYFAINKKNPEEKSEYQIISITANIPLLLVYFVFMAWTYTVDYHDKGVMTFISGFVATIFIVINTIFVFVQMGLIKLVFKKLTEAIKKN